MNPQAEALNKIIQEHNPVVYELLSEKGKNIFFPKKGILGQTAACKNTKINATIGAAFEDDGTIMCLQSASSKVNLDASQVFSYASSYGRADLRTKWQEMIKDKNPSLKTAVNSFPVVTNALTHALSVVAYLFVDEGDRVILPNLYWGNYNLALKNAYGAELQQFNLFSNSSFDIESFTNQLNSGKQGKKIVIFNFPNNPTGYTPTKEEVKKIVAVVKSSAEAGNKIVALVDDAYFGLVYQDGVEQESIFAPLSDLHENVLAVKIDGATKEDYAWGLRVGFVTFGVKNGNKELYIALEDKTGGTVRGNISNASNLSQSLLLSTYKSATYSEEKNEKYAILKARYDEVVRVVNQEKYSRFFNPLPFNSGYFMCVRLESGLDGETIQQILIEKYSVGIILLGDILRIAYSAVKKADIEYLFESIYKVCEEVS